MVDESVRMPAGPDRVRVLGSGERNLKMIREALGVNITARDELVQLRGERDAVVIARNVLERLTRSTNDSNRQGVLALIADEAERYREGGAVRAGLREGSRGGPRGAVGWEGRLDVFAGGRRIEARTENQRHYVEAMRTNDLVFGIGPAGTGKTYLAVAAAVHLLRTERVNRLVLVRPAVEAGEKLGYLPGDLQAKVDPYLRPLLDALHDMVEYPVLRRFMESDVVEVAPLAFMRGRTLNNAVVILDEAQNTTAAQMKMFLTRMGHGTKMIVTGDTTQIDLEEGRQSGLIDAARRLRRVPGSAFCVLERVDVVRHPLVQRVLEAYGDDEDVAPNPRGGDTQADAARNARGHSDHHLDGSPEA